MRCPLCATTHNRDVCPRCGHIGAYLALLGVRCTCRACQLERTVIRPALDIARAMTAPVPADLADVLPRFP